MNVFVCIWNRNHSWLYLYVYERISLNSFYCKAYHILSNPHVVKIFLLCITILAVIISPVINYIVFVVCFTKLGISSKYFPCEHISFPAIYIWTSQLCYLCYFNQLSSWCFMKGPLFLCHVGFLIIYPLLLAFYRQVNSFGSKCN